MTYVNKMLTSVVEKWKHEINKKRCKHCFQFCIISLFSETKEFFDCFFPFSLFMAGLKRTFRCWEASKYQVRLPSTPCSDCSRKPYKPFQQLFFRTTMGCHFPRNQLIESRHLWQLTNHAPDWSAQVSTPWPATEVKVDRKCLWFFSTHCHSFLLGENRLKSN